MTGGKSFVALKLNIKQLSKSHSGEATDWGVFDPVSSLRLSFHCQ